jgi:hypothetical protein
MLSLAFALRVCQVLECSLRVSPGACGVVAYRNSRRPPGTLISRRFPKERGSPTPDEAPHWCAEAPEARRTIRVTALMTCTGSRLWDSASRCQKLE